MNTPRWGVGRFVCLFPARVVGFRVTPHWGTGWVACLPPLGERVGFWVTSRWGSWFNGYFPLGKLVSGLLLAGGEGGLHDYSPLGERVGFYDHFSLGMLGFMVTS